jgi:cytochrome c553
VAPAYATPTPIPANATGTVGPNLDSLQPTYLLGQQQVQNGSGVMPSFRSSLSAQQIRDVAAFVALRATG